MVVLHDDNFVKVRRANHNLVGIIPPTAQGRLRAKMDQFHTVWVLEALLNFDRNEVYTQRTPSLTSNNQQ
jgi:hypothetical protein